MKVDAMDKNEEHFEVNEENYLDLTPDEIADAVAMVKQHRLLFNENREFDSTPANNLIRYFHFMFQSGRIFDSVQLRPEERALLDYVEHAFSRIVTGKSVGFEQDDMAGTSKSANVAFGLSPGQGERWREDTTERDVSAAAYMVLLMRNNWKWEDARWEVANHLFPDGKGEKAVEKAYADLKNEFTLLKEETLLLLAPDNIPKIKARSA